MYSAVFFGCPTTSISPSRVHVDTDLEHRGREHDVERVDLGPVLALLARLRAGRALRLNASVESKAGSNSSAQLVQGRADLALTRSGRSARRCAGCRSRCRSGAGSPSPWRGRLHTRSATSSAM